MDVPYSVAHSITYMTAAFLKVVPVSLTPTSLKSLFPPPPSIPPLRWAPGFWLHALLRRSPGVSSHSNAHCASSKAFVVRSPHHTSRVIVTRHRRCRWFTFLRFYCLNFLILFFSFHVWCFLTQ
jgi:hypothetical protein